MSQGPDRVRLWPDVAVGLAYEDATPFGSPVTDRPDRSTRALFAPVLERLAGPQPDQVEEATRLAADVVASGAFREVAEPQAPDGWRLRDEVLFPDPGRARPRGLVLSRADGRHVEGRLADEDWADVHDLLASLSAITGVDLEDGPTSPVAAALVQAMAAEGLLEPVDGETPIPTGRADLTFVGHNTVVVRSETTSVCLDPYFFADAAVNPNGYQPLQPRHLGPIDAVVLTHSHPDHFVPTSLLQLPRSTTVIVPDAVRETLLAVDMARRLTELGFDDVVTLRWGESYRVGDVEVHALPFFGEQATDADVLHPEIRNVGNTYVVRTPSFSCAFIADAGRDHLGDIRSVARTACRDLGSVDVVFSGYRAWRLYPVQLLPSSVARYFLFVPPAVWRVRQQLMNDAADAVETAELFGARFLVPYADGGAPWHWRAGLGPRLDERVEHPDFDPFPERVVAEAQRRGGAARPSPVEVLLLRPGDDLIDVAGRPDVVRPAGHGWPFGGRGHDGDQARP